MSLGENSIVRCPKDTSFHLTEWSVDDNSLHTTEMETVRLISVVLEQEAVEISQHLGCFSFKETAEVFLTVVPREVRACLFVAGMVTSPSV